MKISHLSNLTVHSGSQFHEPSVQTELKQVCAICVDHKLVAHKTWNLITLVKFFNLNSKLAIIIYLHLFFLQKLSVQLS